MSWLAEHIDVGRPRWKQLVLDDGALPWTGVALGLALLWVLLFLVEVQTPNWLYWSGKTVQGSNQGGIVFYRVHGQTYTIDDPGPAPTHPTPETVWYQAGDPSAALLDEPARLIEAGVFVALAGATVITFGVGATRGELHRRRRPALPPLQRRSART
ncbi:MAG TPA: hypothetical protein VFJ09_06160 [Nocardioidaceae bacterium]|nr:hypothetical protein [Nocardioidaceae bacterium]